MKKMIKSVAVFVTTCVLGAASAFAADVSVASTEALAAAITAAADGDTITLVDGTYTMPTLANKNITFTGGEGVVIDMSASVNANGSTLTFDGVSLKFGHSSYIGFTHAAKIVYKNCSLSDRQTLYAPVAEFTGCVLTHNDSTSVWTYGANDVTFTDCTFKSGGRAVQVYNEATDGNFVADVKFTDCKFYSDGTDGNKTEALVETNRNGGDTAASNKYKLTFTNCSTELTNDDGRAFWGNKGNMDGDHLTVVIDGKTVYPVALSISVGGASYDTIESAVAAAKDANKPVELSTTAERVAIPTAAAGVAVEVKTANATVAFDATSSVAGATLAVTPAAVSGEYEITLTGGTFASATVTIPAVSGVEKVKVYYLDANGAKVYLDGIYDVANGMVTFTTTHFSTWGTEAVAAKIGDVCYASLADAIAAAGDEAVITLFAGTHTMPGSVANKNITIKGDANTDKTTIVVEMLTAVNASGSTINFNGVTVKFDNDNYEGLQHATKVTYTDCIHIGSEFLYAREVVFSNCDFTVVGDAYAVWTYGAGKVDFSNCTFNTDGKAILVYTEKAHEADIALSNCEFNAATNRGKAAVELGQSANGAEASYDLTFTDCTADANFVANNSTSNLWGNKNNMTTASGGGSSVKIDNDKNVMPKPEPVCATVTGVEEKMTLSAALAYANQNAGSVITLDKDATIELANWTAVDMTKAVVIEGNGATITGLTESLVNGTICQITIKDLTISGANIVGKYSSHSGVNNAGAFIGVAAHSTAVLTNCHVLNSVIGSSSDYYAGGLVGYWGGNSTLTVDGCSVINTKITAKSSVGGVVGHAYDGLTILNSKVGGNTITSTDAEVRPDKAGAVIGRNNGGTDSIDVVETAVSTMNPAGTENANRVIGSIVGGSVVITGGEYFADPTLVEKNTLPTVDGVIVEKDNKFIVAKAKIGEDYYTTIQAAIDATAEGANAITVIGNVTERDITIAEDKNVVIDFGEKTLTGNFTINGKATLKNGVIENPTTAYAIKIFNDTVLENLTVNSYAHAVRIYGGNVTVNSGSYTAYGNTGDYRAISASVGTVVINDGVFTGPGATGYDCAAIDNRGSTMTINGGTFKNGGHGTILAYGGTTTIKGGSFFEGMNEFDKNGSVNTRQCIISHGGGEFAIEGGIFNGETIMLVTGAGYKCISGGAFSIPVPDTYCADGYVSATEPVDGMYGVVEDKSVASVTAPDGTVTKYTDVTAAIKAATGSNTAGNYTVTLLKDCTSDIITGFGAVQNAVLDLNGKTLTIPTYFYVANNDTLTIKDSSVEQTGTVLCTNWGGISVSAPNGTLIVESGTLTHDENFRAGYAPINQFGSGKVYINGGRVIAEDGWYAVGSGTVGVKGGTIELNDGTVDGAVYLAATSGVDTLALNGGELDVTLEVKPGYAGTITKAESVTVDAPADYRWVEQDDGTQMLTAIPYVAELTDADGNLIGKYESFTNAYMKASEIPGTHTIKLLDDAIYDGGDYSWNGSVNLTIDLNGNDLTLKKNMSVPGSFYGGNTLAFDDTSAEKDGRVIFEGNAKIEFTNEYPDSVIINGGTFVKENENSAIIGESNFTGKNNVTFNGGNFDQVAGDVFEMDKGDNVTKGENVDVKAPEGYEWNDEGKLVELPPVATVNGVEYTSLAKALEVAKAKTGDVVVKLIADLDLSDWVTVDLGSTTSKSYDSLVLDGNGKTITRLAKPLFGNMTFAPLTITNIVFKDSAVTEATAAGFTIAGIIVPAVGNGGSLTLDGITVEGGTVTSSSDSAAALIGYKPNGSVVTIRNCKITGVTITGGNSSGILFGHAMGGFTVTDTIVGGNTINNTDSSVKSGVLIGTLNGADGVIDVTEETASVTQYKGEAVDAKLIGRLYANVTYNGGEYFTDPTTSYATKNDDVSVTIEDTVNENDGKYFVVPAVAKVGDVTYGSIQEAIDAAAEGQTVTLLKDVAESGTEVDSGEFFIQILGKSVVVDLGGFTLKGSFYLDNGAALTIDNGAIESLEGNKSSCIESVGGTIVLGENLSAHSSVRHAIRVKGGTATINGGTYVADGNSTYHVVNVSHASTVTINGGTFTSNKGNSTSGGNAVMIQDSASKVTIKGGTFTNAAGVEGCISAAAGLVISGGTFDTWTYDRYLAEGCWAFQKYGNDYKGLFFVSQKKKAPVATVNVLGGQTVVAKNYTNGMANETLNLENVYEFVAPHKSGEEALDSQYSTWNADFVVSVDKDIPANSIVLAGNYGSYGWISFTNLEAIEAGREIRLLDLFGYKMNYFELCDLVGTFTCGVTDINGVLDGVNFTVKLNMYPVKPYTDSNTNWNIEDTDAKPITSNEVTFELGSNRNYVAQFGDAKYETINEAITAAKAAPAEDGEKNVVTVLKADVEWAEDFTYDDEVEIRLAGDLDAFTASVPSGYAWVGGVLMKPTNWLHVADTRWYNAAKTAFTLSTEEELAGVAKLVKDGTTTFEGVTITLSRDMDLAKYVWPGIGIYKDDTKSFQGTFDGAGKTISGVTFADDSNGVAASEANNYRALFNYIDNATITDLTVAGNVWETAPASTEYGGALIVGHAKNSTIQKCVAAGTVNGTHNVAGVVVRVQDSTIVNCTNKADLTGSYSKMGGIAALVQDSETSVLFDGCVNEGDITSTARGEDGVGGIVGWVGYPNTKNITVQNCENKGEITTTGAATAGQIAGESWDYDYVFTGNKGLPTTVATGHSAMDGLNYATVADGVATYVKDAELAAGNTYLVTSTRDWSGNTNGAAYAKPVITLAAGQSITFDQTLATIDDSGIKAATELKKTTDGDCVTYTAKGYVVTITWPNETTTDEVADGETFTLAAKELAGMTFIGWSGAYASTAAEAQITVTGDIAITANYLPSELYTEVKGTIEENYKNDNELVNVKDIVDLSLQNPTIQVGDVNGQRVADVGIKLMKATTLKDETNGGKPNWEPVKEGEPISAIWAEDGETILIRLPADKKAQFFRFIPVNGLTPPPPVVSTPSDLKTELEKEETTKVEVSGGTYADPVTVPEGKEVVVKDGSFTPPQYTVAIDSQGQTDLVLDGGTYTVSEYLQIISSQTPGSKVTVNGGTYKGEWLVWGGRDVEVLITGGTFDLWGLVVSDDSTNFRTTVTGGNFTLGDYGFDSNQHNEVIITGGTFNKNPSKYVPDTHTATESNGLWTVTAR